ncbi:carboxypeptidase-like regulatory domain-containing protein [Aquimarina sp. AU58]|uniref:carboxypeptidase-like regulatory domain-containing protein n=1 Tax=Aquimarina sp. AU58 TaxID=1874112 RepID=UPI000D6DC867|nr:carboxypeptidase-like regulatory domain-containing protein [Aquimarina sp. AU58]
MRSKNTSIRLTVLLFLVAGNFIFGQSSSLRKISGYVTHNKIPLQNVHVSVKDGSRKSVTDEKGYYFIEASKREIIQFSFVGMIQIEIVVEDVTKFLNVKMVKEVNSLSEVLVKGNKKEKPSEKEKPSKVSKISTVNGDIDVRNTPYNINIIKGEDLWFGATDLIEAMRGRVIFYGEGWDGIEMNKRVRLRPRTINSQNYAIWDIDGFVTEDLIYVDVADVDYIAVIKSSAATVKYGMRGSGGVIVVRTKSTTRKKRWKKELKEAKKSLYEYDAMAYKRRFFDTEYMKKLDVVPDNELYDLYKGLLSKHKNSPDFYLDVSDFFRIKKGKKKLSLKVLDDMEKVFDKNPETLKALAYTYQELGEKSKAVNIYDKIIHLRPSYTQSFRDLANAYVENKQYRKGWDMYIRYLKRGHKLENKGIEQIVYSEMHSLYSKKKEIAEIKEAFIPKDNEDTSESDLRIVLEWNTSEAEFNLEFVDPRLMTSVYENSLEKNSSRITDQKSKGYSSEEFFVYDTSGGDWLINITYLGNKKYTPTYLKATVYRNWGRKNQTKEIRVFKLTQLNYKIQLFNFKPNL